MNIMVAVRFKPWVKPVLYFALLTKMPWLADLALRRGVQFAPQLGQPKFPGETHV